MKMFSIDKKILPVLSLAMITMCIITFPAYLKLLVKYVKLSELEKITFIQHLDVDFMDALLFRFFPAIYLCFLVSGFLIMVVYFKIKDKSHS